MGAGRKTQTYPLKEKVQKPLTGNFSASARNLRKSDLGAVIFGCKNYTIQECYFKELFGLPASHYSYVQNVDPGLPLFLFNYSDRTLHGIFEAASRGQKNINPYGWISDGSETTPYAAQVRVRVRKQCKPLAENQFKKVIANNYYGEKHFWFELDHAQTQKLITMFSLSPTPATSVPPPPNVAKWNSMCNIAPTSGTGNGQWGSWDAPDAEMDKLLLEGGKENIHAEPKCESSYSSVVGSTNTCPPPKKWSSLFKASTPEAKENDDGKTQGSEVNVPPSYQYNTEWESSAAALWPEGEHSKSYEYEADWESSHVSIWPEGEYSKSEEGEHIKSVDLSENLHHSKEPVTEWGCDTEWESSAAALWPEGEHSKSYEYEADWESSHVSMWPEGEYSKVEEGEHMKSVDLSENLHHSEEPVTEWGCDMLKLGEENQQSEAITDGEEQCFDNEQFTDSTTNSEHSSKRADNISVDHDKKVSPDPSVMANLLGEDDQSLEVDSVSEMKSSSILSAISKLVHGIEELKADQLRQAKKISSLEQELVQSRLEVQLLKKQCNGSCQVPSIRHGQETLIGACDKSCSMVDDSILIVGGFDGSSWLSSLGSYSLSLDQMKALKPMSVVRSYASASTLDGELLILGGVDGNVWHDTVESYKPTSDQWVDWPPLSRKKGSLAVANLNGKIYAAGGGNGVECFSEVDMLDVNTGGWVTARSMIKKRFAPAAADINGVLYVAGGYDGSNYLNSVERFDHREHSWKHIASMSSKRAGHSLVVLNEKLFALGGYDGDQMVSTVEVFDPRLGTWMMGDPMNNSRGYCGAVTMGEKIFVIGGVEGNEKILDTIECYKEGCGWEVTNMRGVGKRGFLSAVVL